MVSITLELKNFISHAMLMFISVLFYSSIMDILYREFLFDYRLTDNIHYVLFVFLLFIFKEIFDGHYLLL